MVLAEIKRCDERHINLQAAVVMPDHVHLIFGLVGEQRLSDALQLIKGRSAKAINQRLGRTGPLWMDESFDRIIRNETELAEKIDYIRQNPVKKDLVSKPSDYEWLLSGTASLLGYTSFRSFSTQAKACATMKNSSRQIATATQAVPVRPAT